MEVRFTGTVTSAPHFFYGTHTQAEHEQFDVRTDAGNPVRIIDNVALAPRVPVRHWTHHDPAGIHLDGFIETGGRVYA